jgi:hypothetical protein
LLVPFKERYLYHPAQKGSASLKKVLPAWFPHLSYKDMAISNGTSVAEEYEKLSSPNLSDEDKDTIRKNLLEYCKLDTYALVVILEMLQKTVAEQYKMAA